MSDLFNQTHSESQITALQPQIIVQQTNTQATSSDIGSRLIKCVQLISTLQDPFWLELMQHILEIINQLIFDIKQQFNNQSQQQNQIIQDVINNQKKTFCKQTTPYIKSNLTNLLEESFGLKDCLKNIIQKAETNNDQKCIRIISDGYFYPKMLQYAGEYYKIQFIVYNARKKKYFRYGPQSSIQKLFLFQKNTQIFNVLHKKTSNKVLQQGQFNSSIKKSPQTIFSKGYNDRNQNLNDLKNQGEIKSIATSMKKELVKSIEKKINSIQDNLQEQLERSIKQVKFQTPLKFSSTKNQVESSSESEENNTDNDINSYKCGGKYSEGKTNYQDLEEYKNYMQKFHKNKIPKESSHLLNGQYKQ